MRPKKRITSTLFRIEALADPERVAPGQLRLWTDLATLRGLCKSRLSGTREDKGAVDAFAAFIEQRNANTEGNELLLEGVADVEALLPLLKALKLDETRSVRDTESR